jgi:hypothetical protein
LTYLTPFADLLTVTRMLGAVVGRDIDGVIGGEVGNWVGGGRVDAD